MAQQVSAKLRYLRIAPRKVRLVAKVIEGKPLKEVEAILSILKKRASKPLLKLIRSASASAKNNFNLEPQTMYLKKVIVSEGPKLKRYRFRARGRIYEVQKKTSHVEVILEEKLDKK